MVLWTDSWGVFAEMDARLTSAIGQYYEKNITKNSTNHLKIATLLIQAIIQSSYSKFS